MLTIDIWSDFLCPYCFLGKRRLERALESMNEKPELSLRYRSFQLDASAAPSQTGTYPDIIARKYGWSADRMKQTIGGLVNAGQAIGIHFQMEKAIVTNSLQAHRLSQLALTQNLQLEVQELVFKAHFEDGLDIARPEVLTEIGTRAGLKAADVEALWSGTRFEDEVRKDQLEARQLGVQGVPFFVFQNRLAVSGAQPPEVFLQAIEEALSL